MLDWGRNFHLGYATSTCVYSSPEALTALYHDVMFLENTRKTGSPAGFGIRLRQKLLGYSYMKKNVMVAFQSSRPLPIRP